MLIDTHAHLSDESIDVSRVVKNMESEGLSSIITVAYDLDSSKECIRIAKENKNIFCAIGVHPNDAQHLQSDPIDELYDLAINNKDEVVMIGEIGLDYHYDGTDREKQKYYLEKQIILADRLSLPPAFHIRDAYEDMFEVFAKNSQYLKNSGIMHCYAGSKQTALELSKKYDFYFSFTGVITFQNAYKFTDIIRALPKERLLVETDCPYLTPHPHRGKKNEPKYVKHTAEKMAEILGISFQEVQELTTENAKRLMKI